MGGLFSSYNVHPTVTDSEVAFRENSDHWYQTGKNYWSKVESTDDGMLGGYSLVSEVDLKFSRSILERLQSEMGMGRNRCADLGAGCGRVSIGALKPYFSNIFLVDPVEKFLKMAEAALLPSIPVEIFVGGAQDWKIEGEFDCFFVQWTIMFLTDTDAIAFLIRCKDHLSKNGVIIVKENLPSTNADERRSNEVFFADDCSTARTYQHFLEIFSSAGLSAIETQIQPDWPPNLMPLYAFSLRPS